VVPGVATLDIKVQDLPPGGEAHIPQCRGTEETRRGSPSLGEYRSGGTGCSHLGIGNFSRPVSSGLEPYCGVKCGLWVHFPATILY